MEGLTVCTNTDGTANCNDTKIMEHYSIYRKYGIGGPYQQVFLLTINISRADGIQGLVVFSNSPLSLVWT